MKKKLLAMTLASAMCVGMLAGCGGGSSASTDGGDSGSDDAYNISVIVKLTDGHFNKVMAGARTGVGSAAVGFCLYTGSQYGQGSHRIGYRLYLG